MEKKIKDPENYIYKRLKKLSKVNIFKSKKKEFSILLTNNQKMKNLNKKFRKKINLQMFYHFQLTTK